MSRIKSNQKVGRIVSRHPETYAVFASYDVNVEDRWHQSLTRVSSSQELHEQELLDALRQAVSGEDRGGVGSETTLSSS